MSTAFPTSLSTDGVRQAHNAIHVESIDCSSRLFHNQLVRNNSFKSIHGFGRWVFCRSQDNEYRLESSFSLLPKKYSPKFHHEPETEQVRVVT